MQTPILSVLRRSAVIAGLVILTASVAVSQQRDQGGGSSVPKPPAPGETVREVPPGWRVAGPASDQAGVFYRQYMAAFNWYIQAESQYGPTSNEAAAARREYTSTLETYYRNGLGMVRVTQPPASPQDETTSPSEPSQDPDTNVQPQVVEISENVRIEELDFQLFEQDVTQGVSGYPWDLTTVWVTIHGRVTDSVGNPVSGAVVRLTRSGVSSTTDSNGEYSASFKRDGFENIKIPLNIVLDSRCLVIEPNIVSFGTLALGEAREEFVSVENTCAAETIDVSFGIRRKVFHLRIVDCTSGQDDGVIWSDRSTKITMGPGARCKMRLSFEPTRNGSWDETFYLKGSDVPGSLVALRALATASDTVIVGQKEGHFSGTTTIGASSLWVFTIKNGSQSSTLNIVELKLAGAAAGDFRAAVAVAPGAAPPPSFGAVAPPPGTTPLSPGGQCMVEVTFEPQAIGLREAVLDIMTSDPIAPVVKIPVSGLGSP